MDPHLAKLQLYQSEYLARRRLLAQVSAAWCTAVAAAHRLAHCIGALAAPKHARLQKPPQVTASSR
jgi:hypothetical protein